MDTVIRSLWLLRASTVGALLATALVGVVAAPAPWTVAALAIALAVGVAGIAATARQAASLRSGDRGELLFRSGARAPWEDWRAAHRADRAELPAAFVVVVLFVLGGATWMAAIASVPIVVLIALGRHRRWSRAYMEAHHAWLEHDLERADRRLGPAERAPISAYRDAAREVRWLVQLGRGERDAVLRAMEAAWNGALDDRAASVALLRIGAGDPALLERVVAARPADGNRYDRYLTALCRAQLALHGRRWDEAIAAARAPLDVPDWYLRQLVLLEAAALQGAGRTDEARGRLAGLVPGLESEQWRRIAYPLQAGLLEDAGAGRPTTALAAPLPPAPVVVAPPPAAGPFAPPSAVPPVRVVPRPAKVGVVPVEGMGLVQPRGKGASAVLLGVAFTLATLCAVLLALVGALLALGVDEPLVDVSLAVGPLGLVFATLLAAEFAFVRRDEARPSVVLADGRRIGERWFAPWAFALVVRTGATGAVLLLAFAFAEGFLADLRWVWVPVVPLALLFAWASWRVWRDMRLVRAVHFLPPPAALDLALRSRPAGRGLGWVALARLWTGDAEGAERQARDAAIAFPDLAWIEGWLRAGRGEVDLDRMLAEADPEGLGDRYRRAVQVAVAALRAGAAARVLDRLDDWTHVAEQLPNRYGALLARLVAGVRRANGQPVPVDAAHPDVAWVATVWPFVP